MHLRLIFPCPTIKTRLSKVEVEDTPEHFVTCIKAGGITDIVER